MCIADCGIVANRIGKTDYWEVTYYHNTDDLELSSRKLDLKILTQNLEVHYIVSVCNDLSLFTF